MKQMRRPERDAGRKTRVASAKPKETKTLPIVGVGASAGGLEALTQLLQNLPVDTGMAFVLVQHLDPEHESALTEILARTTSMTVLEVRDMVVVQANHVYVIPPGKTLSVKGGQLRLEPRKEASGAARSIDTFLESLAQEQQEGAIGVILSGTASDGTLGLEAIKAEGGVTFAQDGSAKYDSMPRNAIAAGCVDYVLPPEGIAKELARIARHPYVIRGGPAAVEATAGGDGDKGQAAPVFEGEVKAARGGENRSLKKILLQVRNRCAVDFSFYKPSTIQRRVHRRMVLSRCETLEAYANFVSGSEKEQDALYSDLLISVTGFFRNPEAFDALKREVFDRLLRQRPLEEPVRIWVAGCSTGQEVYSIAMAYREFCGDQLRAPELQIFGTDLNEALLEKARQGLYTEAQVEELSPERRDRFFLAEAGRYRVNKGLRECCIFARQNLLSDPTFSRLDLISCRNLLIYIDEHSQQKILPAFHYALKPNGFLFLGASESLGGAGEAFEAVDKTAKIFRRKPGKAPKLALPVSRSRPEGGKPRASAGMALGNEATETSALREADRVIATRFAPPVVLVDSNFHVVQSRGETGEFLGLGAGKASFDVMKMVRGDLMLPLRAALTKARRHGKVVRTEPVNPGHDTGGRTASLEVIPLKNLKEYYYLICFEAEGTAGKGQRAEELPPQSGPGVRAQTGAAARRVAALERELRETRDYLHSVQEQHEAATEELQAANEEMTSANEELQSLNEELETSKEELESTNEELTTVNEEMVNRNQELNRVNSDLNNLHASINTPVLVVSRDLRIQRFTALAEKVFNLLANDVGRPLGDIRHNLIFPELETFIAEAISSISPREKEVQDHSGNWYLLRVRPYLTVENKIDGAVLLLVDVNTLKRTEARTEEARHFAQAVIESVPPLAILELDLRVRKVNMAFYETFDVTAEQTEGRLIYELGNGQWNIPELRKLLEEIVPRATRFKHYEVTHHFEKLGRRTMLMSGCRVDHLRAIVLSVEDITERKEAEEARQRSEEQLAQAVRTAGLGIFEHDHRTDTLEFSPMLRALFGFEDQEPVTLARILQRVAAEDREALSEALGRAHNPAGGGKFEVDYRISDSRGRVRWMTARSQTVFEGLGSSRQALRTVGAVLDITERRGFQTSLERLVRERTAKLEELVGDLDHFSYTITHDMRAPLRSMIGFAELMAEQCSGCLQEDAKGFVSRIKTSASRMDALITDALRYSRSVRQELDLAPTDPAAILRGMLDSYPEFQPSKARIELAGEIPRVIANEAGLTQCFSNLLGNAVKFVEPGKTPEVRIWAEVLAPCQQAESDQAGPQQPSAPRAGRVRIWFEDKGIGIAKEAQGRVFDMFHRASKHYEGTGIGLALVRKVTQRMGGRVGVKSEEGKGSQFWLELQAAG